MVKVAKKKPSKAKRKSEDNGHVLVVAQEIKFARLLSGNEKKSRDRVLRSLKKWLANCFQKHYEFKEDDFARVWKGLFYAVWMSDKPLVQEELCEEIARLLDAFPPEQIKNSVLMLRAGLRILATEWYGIDQHRMDKFLMLVRRLLRAAFRVLHRCDWSLDSCKHFSDALINDDGLFSVPTPTYARNSLSLLLHITESYLEELAKVSKGELQGDSLVELVRPFAKYLAEGAELRLAVACRKSIFTYLVRQSERGQEYETRRQIWSRMGCPKGGPDALVPDSDDDDDAPSPSDDDDDNDGSSPALDPRAGRVDVVLATLPVPAEKLASLLQEYLRTTTSSAHRRVKICYQRFVQLSTDEYPLRVPDDVADASSASLRMPRKTRAARSLDAFEQRLALQSDELALKDLGRKQRKRLLAKSRSGVSIVEERAKLGPLATNGAWQVEDADASGQKKRKMENKENLNEQRNSKKRKRGADKKDFSKKLRSDKSPKKSMRNRNENEIKDIKKDNSQKKGKKDLTPKMKGLEDSKKGNVKKTTKDPVLLVNGARENKMSTPKIKSKDSVLPVNVKENKKSASNIKTKNPVLLVNGVKDNKTSAPKTKSRESVLLVNKTSEPKIKSKDSVLPVNKTAQKTKSKDPVLLVNKVKKFQKNTVSPKMEKSNSYTPKKVQFALKNNSMQGTVDYYKSIRNSPSIPYDSTKKPRKTNLKPNSTPSPINPFFKKKLGLKFRKFLN